MRVATTASTGCSGFREHGSGTVEFSERAVIVTVGAARQEAGPLGPRET